MERIRAHIAGQLESRAPNIERENALTLAAYEQWKEDHPATNPDHLSAEKEEEPLEQDDASEKQWQTADDIACSTLLDGNGQILRL